MEAETHYEMLDPSIYFTRFERKIVAIIYVATVEPPGKKERALNSGIIKFDDFLSFLWFSEFYPWWPLNAIVLSSNPPTLNPSKYVTKLGVLVLSFPDLIDISNAW